MTIVPSPVLIIATIVIAAGIFVLDTITRLEIAFAVLYVAVVLIAVRFLPQRSVMLVSGGCIGLTILSASLSRSDPLHAVGIINCVLSIVAIGATTYLGLKNQSAGMALQDARAELAHVNRVATLGELTAAIAHEVNQPIGGAVTNAEAALRFLAAQPADLEEVRQALDAVVEDGKRASEIIARIRDLMAKPSSRIERLDINAVVREVIGLMRGEIQKNQILLQTQLAADLPAVVADRIQLQQVFLNLILNAIEAVSASRGGIRELRIVTEKRDGGGIEVTVQDSGPGLSAENAQRAFESFYTTKTGGIGVGLSICRTIVEASGGRIWAAATAGRGATFKFSLPAAKG